MIAIDLVLVAMFVALEQAGVETTILSITAERSVPTWYAAMKLFVLSQILITLAFSRPARGWRLNPLPLALAAVFLVLSVDEVASFHERVGRHLTAWMSGDVPAYQRLFHRTGYWMLALAPPLTAVLVTLGIAYARTDRPAPATVRKGCVGFALLLGGAVGIEALQNFIADGAALALAIAVEEGCELLGVTLMLWAAADELLRGDQAAAPRPRR